METRILKGESGIEEAVKFLSEGQTVAIPTETVYGLAANAFNPEACARIYGAKQRPSDNPLIVHVADLEMLKKVIEPTLFADAFACHSLNGEDIVRNGLCSGDLELVKRLRVVAKAFWPGPLTLILPKSPAIPDIVVGVKNKADFRDTVAVRMPAHPIALKIIEMCGFPLAAPSANLSGHVSPTLAQHVFKDLNGRIPLIIDDTDESNQGQRLGVESTVLDLTVPKPTILRPGSITLEQLREVLPETELYLPGSQPGMEDRPPTPGLKYRHYSPRAPLYLCLSAKAIPEVIQKLQLQNYTILTYGDSHPDNVESPGKTEYLAEKRNDYAIIASNLFAKLRDADEKSDLEGCLIVEGCKEEREGVAVMNRLRKAATQVFQ